MNNVEKIQNHVGAINFTNFTEIKIVQSLRYLQKTNSNDHGNIICWNRRKEIMLTYGNKCPVWIVATFANWQLNMIKIFLQREPFMYSMLKCIASLALNATVFTYKILFT